MGFTEHVFAEYILALNAGVLSSAGYLFAFSLAALVCVGAAWRARSVPDPDTRYGLVALFLISGAWSTAYIGFLLAGSAAAKSLFYQASLIVGFGAVWAWLWFCSAYTGRTLHRTGAAWRLAAAVFSAAVLLKITNPLHGLYYSLEPSGGAFGLVVRHGILYWVVMGVSYALSGAGYLMLFERFVKTDLRAGPLALLTGLTATPAALNVIGYASPVLRDITHEPLGVAVFAVGVLVVYETQFSTVRAVGDLEKPNLTVGPGRTVRDLGGGAVEAIPGLGEDAVGSPLRDVAPGLAEALQDETPVWTVASEAEAPDADAPRHYQIMETGLGGAAESRIVVLSDITERRRRQRRLERRDDFFRKAQALADVGAWEYDVQEDRLRWSKEVYRIHGLPEDTDPTPDEAVNFYHQEDRPEIREAFTRAIEEGEPCDEELRIRRPDGSVRWVRVYGEPQVEGGDTARVRGAFQDITEQKRREETLRKLREKYQGLLEGAPDAIFVADVESGRIMGANHAAASLLGTTTEELIGCDQSELHPSGDAEKYRSLFRRAVQGAEKDSKVFSELEDGTQVFVETDSGEQIPVEISATRVDLGGEEAGGEALVGIFRDITEQRTRENVLRAAKEGAEKARREAEEAARLKSAVLANMSHEIRTPLTSIIGFAEAIGENAEAASRFAPLIEKSGKRLLETLNGVLTLSELEAGQVEFDEETVGLKEEAKTLVEELRPQAEEAGIGCRVEANGRPVRARADKGGVQIALRNLVANAIKYTEDGEVVVRAYRKEGASREGGTSGQEGQAVLEVEDTGIGMDPEVAEDLFEPFRQASEGMSREYEGTGVGLAVTKEAIDQMGGSIEVETEKGEGSRFIVRLPRAEGSGGEGSSS
ncbi:MAG: PAS domain-containing sensor histidine kinase [Bacteroidetes bacterium QH_9_64_21]|nr:MAG: PAS domain-containing sensor histidine kinase [Bacteroidetes bacterium QH_9_64_21]